MKNDYQMRADRLENKKRVYLSMLSSFKTINEISEELGLGYKVVENALKYLSEYKLIRKRRDETDRPGVAFAYTSCDTSRIYSFEEKLHFAKNGTPEIIGRCDFAASWIPRVSEHIERSEQEAA